jgi:hypothetical protein
MQDIDLLAYEAYGLNQQERDSLDAYRDGKVAVLAIEESDGVAGNE